MSAPEVQIPVEDNQGMVRQVERAEAMIGLLCETIQAKIVEPTRCRASFRQLSKVSASLTEVMRWITILLECRAAAEERDAQEDG